MKSYGGVTHAVERAAGGRPRSAAVSPRVKKEVEGAPEPTTPAAPQGEPPGRAAPPAAERASEHGKRRPDEGRRQSKRAGPAAAERDGERDRRRR